jgi:Fe-S cluster assembly protein SufB
MSLKSLEEFTSREYKYGFQTPIETDVIPKGLNEDVVALISKKKNEPAWMLEFRLKAYRRWKEMKEPHWGDTAKYEKIDYQDMSYYAAPKQKPEQLKSMEEVDPELKKTFEKLGIPLMEQKRLAGVAVDAVCESVSVATSCNK